MKVNNYKLGKWSSGDIFTGIEIHLSGPPNKCTYAGPTVSSSPLALTWEERGK